ncbi:23S rRNA (guanosine(2251)-2'-O)-methyltransferase RlmB [Nitrospirota bacterium]
MISKKRRTELKASKQKWPGNKDSSNPSGATLKGRKTADNKKARVKADRYEEEDSPKKRESSSRASTTKKKGRADARSTKKGRGDTKRPARSSQSDIDSKRMKDAPRANSYKKEKDTGRFFAKTAPVLSEDGKPFIYGINPIMEALAAERTIDCVYIYAGRRRNVRPLQKAAEERGVEVQIVQDGDFFDSRFPKGHQGVAASGDVGVKTVSLEELMAEPAKRGEDPFFLILDSIEDPRNLGAIVRTADAAGVHGVVTQEYRAASIGPEAAKTSAGALEHVPLCVVPNVKTAMRQMQQAGIVLVGAEATGDIMIWDADLKGGVALVIGSEGRGLRRTVRSRCNTVVKLPMRGKVNSLNASVAAGILVFEYLRQNS